MPEPVSVGTVALTVAKVGASVMLPALRDKTVRLWVARSAAPRLADDGIAASESLLRKWMKRPDVQKQLALGKTATVESALLSLESLLPDTGHKAQDARRVVRVLCEQVVACTSPGTSNMMVYRYLSAQIEAQYASNQAWFAAHTEIGSEAAIDARVVRDILPWIHPWLRDDVRRFANAETDFRALMLEHCRSGDRRDLLTRWAESGGTRVAPISPEAVGLLAEIANTHGAFHACATFARVARARGAEPQEYLILLEWISLQLPLPAESARLEELIDECPRRHPLAEALTMVATDAAAAGSLARAHVSEREFVAGTASAIASSILEFSGDLEGAIAAVDGAMSAIPNSEGLGTLGARLRLQAAAQHRSADRVDDLSRALALALSARDKRRSWHASGADAASVATDICMTMGDFDRALAIASLAPEGEATVEETSDPQVLAATARLLAMRGDAERALAIATQNGDDYLVAMVRGLSALHVDDVDQAVEEWNAAWQAATNDHDRLVVAMNLALTGGDLPPLDQISAGYAEALAEIEELHAITSASGQDRLSRLRTASTKSPRFAMLAADEEAARGDLEGSANILRDAGERWQDPTLVRLAARRYVDANEYAQALSAVELAVSMAPHPWHDQVPALKTKFDALEGLGRRDDAIAVARYALRLAPGDAGVRWVLVLCLARRGDSADAWATIVAAPSAFEPRSFQEAHAWVAVAAREADDDTFVRTTVRLADRWSERGEDVTLLLGQLLLRPTSATDERSDEAVELVQEAMRRHVTADSGSALVMLRGETDEDLIEAILALMRAHRPSDEIRALVSRVALGELPLGLLAEIKHSPFTEILSRRPVAIHAFGEEPQVPVLDRTVAIDLTALSTLAALPDALATTLLALFTSLEVPDGCVTDAQAGLESVQRTAATTWIDDGGQPHFESDTAEQAARVEHHAQRVVDLARGVRRVGWYPNGDDPMASWTSAWALAFNYAKASKRALWCDDLTLRVVARSEGVETFSTDDVLRAALGAGRIEPELARTSRAIFVREHYVDVDADRDTLREAAVMSNWRPEGAATALTRPAMWRRDGALAAAFLFEAIGNAVDDPRQVRAWAANGIYGILRAVSDVTNGSKALAHVTETAMGQPWLTADTFPHFLSGVRDAIDSVARTDAIEHTLDLTPALQAAHTALISTYGRPRAALRMRSLVAALDVADRQVATHVMLTAQ